MNTTYWRNTIMTAIYGSGGSTNFYVGLSSTAPTAAGGNVTEPAANNYARVQIASFTAPDDGSVSNAAAIVFPTSTGVWFPGSAPATHWVVFDGAGAGAHVLSSGTLDEAVGVYNKTTITIPANEIVISLIDDT